jgi:hypothetical protein
MGDEPYAALLPWTVFAVIDRAQGDPVWAGIGALVTALALLATSTRRGGRPNILMLGAVVWFAGIAVAGAVQQTDTGLLAQYGRAISAAGFALIAFGSLAFHPVVEHYTRPHVRSTQLTQRAFARVNILITLIWGAAFTGIALSHVVGVSVQTPEGVTVFNWVVPIALAAIAAHRTRIAWDDFNDDDTYEPDPMRNLEIDWEPPMHHPIDR